MAEPRLTDIALHVRGAGTLFVATQVLERELRRWLEQAVVLPDASGDHWNAEVRMTKHDLMELLNSHAVAQVNAALNRAVAPSNLGGSE